MDVDELRRALRDTIDDIPLRDANVDAVVRTGRRRVARRRAAGAVLVAALTAAVLVPLTVQDRSRPSSVRTSGATDRLAGARWSVHRKQTSGLSSGSFAAMASTGRSLLLAGSRPVGPQHLAQAAIWYSEDATTWHRAEMPTTPGGVNAIASGGGTAIAIGTDRSGLITYVWESNDRGRHWSVRARGTRLFGDPAPEMGRPSVHALRYLDGTWIASGGSSSGYAAVWTSMTGSRWRQVLDSVDERVAGSIDLVPLAEGGLFGYWVNIGWSSPDGSSWSRPRSLTVPRGLGLQTVAADATVAFGDPLDIHGQPTPLLLSDDHGRTWTDAPQFLARFPSAIAVTVQRSNGLWIAAGTSGRPNHPDAWLSSDLTNWQALSSKLGGTPGGTLDLVGSIGTKIILLGTAPELDRYYTLKLRHP